MQNIQPAALSAKSTEGLFTPQHVANFFLEKAEAEGRALSPLKLLKLVYIAYGWVLTLIGTKLFDEQIQAWKHGPVIPSLYHEFKHFGKEPITDRATSFDLETWDTSTPSIPAEDGLIRPILEKMWSAYKKFSGWTLRNKTHEPGTPWSQTYVAGVTNTVIPDTLIANHFESKIREILDEAERTH